MTPLGRHLAEHAWPATARPPASAGPDAPSASASAASARNPNSRKHSAVRPYWMPMTLWSVEKIYFRQKPGFLMVRLSGSLGVLRACLHDSVVALHCRSQADPLRPGRIRELTLLGAAVNVAIAIYQLFHLVQHQHRQQQRQINDRGQKQLPRPRDRQLPANRMRKPDKPAPSISARRRDRPARPARNTKRAQADRQQRRACG